MLARPCTVSYTVFIKLILQLMFMHIRFASICIFYSNIKSSISFCLCLSLSFFLQTSFCVCSHMSLSECFDLFPLSVSSLERRVNSVGCTQLCDHQISHFIEIAGALHAVKCAIASDERSRNVFPRVFSGFLCKLK